MNDDHSNPATADVSDYDGQCLLVLMDSYDAIDIDNRVFKALCGFGLEACCREAARLGEDRSKRIGKVIERVWKNISSDQRMAIHLKFNKGGVVG